MKQDNSLLSPPKKNKPLVIILPKSFHSSSHPYRLSFWNQLFFWVTMITSVKLWLSHRRLMTKDKVLITINGIQYYARHITISDGHIFLDGRYVGPEDIDDIQIIDS